MAHEAGLKLPPLLVGPVDLGRLIREIEAIDDNMLQLKLRKSGGNVNLPKTSILMEQLVSLNNVNLLHETDRKRLNEYLLAIKEKAKQNLSQKKTEPGG